MLKKRWSLRDLVPFKADSRPADSAAIDQADENEASSLPHPGRPPPLNPKTEAKLRIACAAILCDIIPAEFLDINNPDGDEADEQNDKVADTIPVLQSTRVSMGDFPIPIASSKYSYRPDATVEDLDLSRDMPTRFVAMAEARKRSDANRSGSDAYSYSKSRDKSRPISQAISVTTNITTVNEISVASRDSYKGEAQDSTPILDAIEYTWSASGPQNNSARGRRLLHRTSLVNPRARHSSSIYQAATMDQLCADIPSKRSSQAASSIRGTQEYIRPDSFTEHSIATSREPSVRSRRSSASSGVMPKDASRFSLRAFRKSWSSWKDYSDDDDLPRRYSSRLREEKRQSGGDKRYSLNLPTSHGVEQPRQGDTNEPEWTQRSHVTKLRKKRPSSMTLKTPREESDTPDAPASSPSGAKSQAKKDDSVANSFVTSSLVAGVAILTIPTKLSGVLETEPETEQTTPTFKATPSTAVTKDDHDTTPALRETIVSPPSTLPRVEDAAMPIPTIAAEETFTGRPKSISAPPTPFAPQPALVGTRSATPDSFKIRRKPLASARSFPTTPVSVIPPRAETHSLIQADHGESSPVKTAAPPHEALTPSQTEAPTSQPSQTDSVIEGQDMGLKLTRSTLSLEIPPATYGSSLPSSKKARPRSKTMSMYSLVTKREAKRHSAMPAYNGCAAITVDEKRRSALPKFQYIDCISSGSPELVSKKTADLARPTSLSPPSTATDLAVLVPDIMVETPTGERRRPSKLHLLGPSGGSLRPTSLYQRVRDEESGETSFERNMSIVDYNALRAVAYKRADDISTLGAFRGRDPSARPLTSSGLDGKVSGGNLESSAASSAGVSGSGVLSKKKSWSRLLFRSGRPAKTPKTWMDKMEKMGIRDGVLITDNLTNAAPIVRY